MIHITECPRDAMQGIREFIPTELKTEYLNLLLKVGFDVLDFGSFVSPKAIPQMRDTEAVLKGLSLSGTDTKLLAIIANERGAEQACSFPEISFLGFPFSISETFQQRNANSSIKESVKRVQQIQDLCARHGKELLVYISMAFGNPYGDEWTPEIAMQWCRKMKDMGINHLALADTVGSSDPQSITSLFSTLLPELQEVTIGAHLHSTKENALEKIEAAYSAGCRNFDLAIHGFGGCPMAKEELTGNLATETLIGYCQARNIHTGLNSKAFEEAAAFSWKIFNVYS